MFFDNDLWMLNPETDILIQMFPESFFIAMSAKIVFGLLWRGIIVYFISMMIERYVKEPIKFFS